MLLVGAPEGADRTVGSKFERDSEVVIGLVDWFVVAQMIAAVVVVAVVGAGVAGSSGERPIGRPEWTNQKVASWYF